MPFPTYEEGDASCFEMVVAGRELPDGDVAVMMVEAGGTEIAWDNYQGGAPKVTEEEIARGLEAAKPYIRQLCQLQRELVEEAGAEAADGLRRAARLHAGDLRGGRGRRRVPAWPTPSASPTRSTAMAAEGDVRDDRSWPSCCPASPTPTATPRSTCGRPSARPPRRRCGPASSTRACASTGGAPPTCGRWPPRSAWCPPPTARASSSGARPRCSTSPRWAWAAWTR